MIGERSRTPYVSLTVFMQTVFFTIPMCLIVYENSTNNDKKKSRSHHFCLSRAKIFSQKKSLYRWTPFRVEQPAPHLFRYHR